MGLRGAILVLFRLEVHNLKEDEEIEVRTRLPTVEMQDKAVSGDPNNVYRGDGRLKVALESLRVKWQRSLRERRGWKTGERREEGGGRRGRFAVFAVCSTVVSTSRSEPLTSGQFIFSSKAKWDFQ